jgi:predicted HNH restriction endonuclease
MQRDQGRAFFFWVPTRLYLMGTTLRKIGEKWEVWVYLAGLLITIGMNWEMAQQTKADVSKLQDSAIVQAQLNADQNADIEKNAIHIENIEPRLSAVEVNQHADHDAIIGMVQQVNTIAKWVEKQDGIQDGRRR